jgi:hypothetical protein
MEDAGDVVGVVDNLEDLHAAAALATDGDVKREDPGEELGQPMRLGLGEDTGASSSSSSAASARRRVSCCSGAGTTAGGMTRARR